MQEEIVSGSIVDDDIEPDSRVDGVTAEELADTILAVCDSATDSGSKKEQLIVILRSAGID